MIARLLLALVLLGGSLIAQEPTRVAKPIAAALVARHRTVLHAREDNAHDRDRALLMLQIASYKDRELDAAEIAIEKEAGCPIDWTANACRPLPAAK